MGDGTLGRLGDGAQDSLPVGLRARRGSPARCCSPGAVTFHRIDDGTTRVMVQMDFLPEGLKEKVGAALGAPDRRVKGDLERFKELIESRGSETGAWRGEVKRPDES
jgi:hypothetical protein